ncbi:MAG: tRNA (guanosine(46)-N(7))-methyltransferase TrmB [Pseudomonadota bacterium]
MSDNRRSRASEAFWGRRRGKTLKPLQADALQAARTCYFVDLAKGPSDRLADLFGHAPEAIHLEIGFGGGEHLLAHALRRPSVGFIGAEPFVNSMAKMASAMEEADVNNIRLYDDDATQLLDWLPNASLDGIDLLYPDPWPKPRHWKRRFVSHKNLDRFARVMKPGALFRFASDIETYVNWTLQHTLVRDDFNWIVEDATSWRNPYPHWVRTRYEAKAIREERTPCYLTFERV